MHGPTCIFWVNLTPFSLQAKEGAVLRIQAAWRGKSGRSAAQEQKAIDERRRTLTESLPPPELFEGRERVLEVKRVAWEGDRRWINRLNHELDVSEDEFRDGYRYRPGRPRAVKRP